MRPRRRSSAASSDDVWRGVLGALKCNGTGWRCATTLHPNDGRCCATFSRESMPLHFVSLQPSAFPLVALPNDLIEAHQSPTPLVSPLLHFTLHLTLWFEHFSSQLSFHRPGFPPSSAPPLCALLHVFRCVSATFSATSPRHAGLHSATDDGRHRLLTVSIRLYCPSSIICCAGCLPSIHVVSCAFSLPVVWPRTSHGRYADDGRAAAAAAAVAGVSVPDVPAAAVDVLSLHSTSSCPIAGTAAAPTCVIHRGPRVQQRGREAEEEQREGEGDGPALNGVVSQEGEAQAPQALGEGAALHLPLAGGRGIDVVPASTCSTVGCVEAVPVHAGRPSPVRTASLSAGAGGLQHGRGRRLVDVHLTGSHVVPSSTSVDPTAASTSAHSLRFTRPSADGLTPGATSTFSSSPLLSCKACGASPRSGFDAGGVRGFASARATAV